MSLTGANVPFGKAIVLEIPVLVFLAFRFGVASLLLMFVVRGEPGPRLAELDLPRWREIAVLAGVGSVLFTSLLLEGTKRTSAVDAGIITATIPAVVALIGSAMSRRLPSAPQALLIGLAVTGLIAVQSGNVVGRSTSASDLAGNMLVGLAVLCEAIFVVISQSTSMYVRPIRLSLAVSLASLAFVLPLAGWAWGGFDPTAVRAQTWALAVWYAVSSSVLCTILW